jgi:predicted PurR-regulated permease PerM
MGDVARKSFVATLVAVAVVAGALAFWHLKVLVALLLLGVIIASAMRPGVDWLKARHIPRSVWRSITSGSPARSGSSSG